MVTLLPHPSSLLHMLFHSLAAGVAVVWKWRPSTIAEVCTRLELSQCAFAGFWGFPTSSFVASDSASPLADCF